MGNIPRYSDAAKYKRNVFPCIESKSHNIIPLMQGEADPFGCVIDLEKSLALHFDQPLPSSM